MDPKEQHETLANERLTTYDTAYKAQMRALLVSPSAWAEQGAMTVLGLIRIACLFLAFKGVLVGVLTHMAQEAATLAQDRGAIAVFSYAVRVHLHADVCPAEPAPLVLAEPVR
ncbi:hypothetical protein [Pseudomonas sp. JG-B]|uniref:hypothetical protein n=1 Tax=Pseudomonas sp. JG-B TaxID=2603214 RepID=UPI00129DE364|nr:hypothetical protein [Pseudomonas sp. JG-B]MRK19112.1 hypothetical protein [Pseudomonas sp. JG-B]